MQTYKELVVLDCVAFTLWYIQSLYNYPYEYDIIYQVYQRKGVARNEFKVVRGGEGAEHTIVQTTKRSPEVSSPKKCRKLEPVNAVSRDLST